MFIRGDIGFALAVATGALSGLRSAGAFSRSPGILRAATATRRASSAQSASVAAGGGNDDDGPTADAASPAAAAATTTAPAAASAAIAAAAAAATDSNDPLLPPLRDGLRRTSVAVRAATSDRVFDSAPSLSQLRKRVRQLTDVAPSSLGGHAGLGLFATKNVKAGTVVGLYPLHALGYELGDKSVFLTGNSEDEEYFKGHPHGNSPYLHATDQPIFRRPSALSPLFDETEEMAPPLYLDVNPNRNGELDGIWTSHYINDGASLLDVRASGASMEEGMEQYYAQSTSRKNCIHIPFGPSPVLATVTTKKVKKGQELFTSYGVVYWLGAVDDIPEGEEESTPGMMEKIQSQIVQSARDLQKAMEDARRGYATEMADLEKALGDL